MSSISLRRAFLLLIALWLAVPASALAQAPAASSGAAGEETASAADAKPAAAPPAMRSPRAVLATFVQRMRLDAKAKATELLDLSNLSTAAAGSRGPDLAFKLYEVLTRLGELPPPAVSPPTDPDGVATNIDEYPGVPNEDEVGEEQNVWALSEWADGEGFDLAELAPRVTIARADDGRWRFSAATVAVIDDLYARVRPQERLTNGGSADEPTVTIPVWIEEQAPEWAKRTHFLMPTYQWLCLLLVVLPVSRVIELVTRRSLTRIADFALHRFDPDFGEGADDKDLQTTRPVWKPVGRLVNAATWVVGAGLLGLPLPVTNVLMTILVVVTIIMAVFAVFAVVDLVIAYLKRRAGRHALSFNKLMLPLAESTLKVLAIVIGLIAAMATFSDELPTTLLAGFGIGGIAIALASQETLSNFVGSVSLLFDRPFEVGDLVKIEGIEGEIESLGFRSTRIRTGFNSQVTMPNSKLASAVIDNWGRRRYRRYLTTLGLEYGTPADRIDAFCEGVRELVRRHPHTRKDFYAVYFNDFGASSLDVFLVVFFAAPDLATELRERHRLLTDILRLAERLGVEFAFPTQTLHLRRDDESALPPELTDASPTMSGARAAADIAGDLPNYQDRPGRVKFTGPTDVGKA